jgi:HEAT repeat protein
MLKVLLIQALGKLGAVEAIALIRSFAADPDHHVRERVQMALERLETGGAQSA